MQNLVNMRWAYDGTVAKLTKGTSQPEGFTNQANAHIFTFCNKTGEFSQQEALMINTWFTVISEVRKSKTATFMQ